MTPTPRNKAQRAKKARGRFVGPHDVLEALLLLFQLDRVNCTAEKKTAENLRKAKARLEMKCEGHPDMSSFLMKRAFTKNSERSCIRFIRRQFKKFEHKMVMPIKPNRNSVRLNIQSPQAMRMFFSKSTCPDDCGLSSRFFYGPAGLLKSMGPDPRQMKVFGVDKCLENLIKDISEKVQKSLEIMSGWEGSVDFNSVEFKFYFGRNVCAGITIGADGKFLKCDNNKQIGKHVDCRFSEEGEQISTDTVDGAHPIATVTIGGTRQLTFFTEERKNGKLQECRRLATFDLHHNSLFVLVPWEDEKFKERRDRSFTRYKHSAKFNGNDFSVAMVFRKVNEKSVEFFQMQSGALLLEESSPAKHFLAKHRKEFDCCRAMSRLPEQRAAMQTIGTRLVSMTTELLEDQS
jgi:hypothetical protein